jgi:two-component system OmpR family response regulator
MSILEYLALNRGRVISPDKLLNQIYDSNSYSSKNAIEVHISGLRKKLRAEGVTDLVETRRGFGYLIA